MKVYVLVDNYYAERDEGGVEIIGVYRTKEAAINTRKKVIKSNTEDDDLDWQLDEETQDLEADIVRLFYAYQENWLNYFELEIIESILE